MESPAASPLYSAPVLPTKSALPFTALAHAKQHTVKQVPHTHTSPGHIHLPTGKRCLAVAQAGWCQRLQGHDHTPVWEKALPPLSTSWEGRGCGERQSPAHAHSPGCRGGAAQQLVSVNRSATGALARPGLATLSLCCSCTTPAAVYEQPSAVVVIQGDAAWQRCASTSPACACHPCLPSTSCKQRGGQRAS